MNARMLASTKDVGDLPKTIRVLLVDDNANVRAGIRNLLGNYPDIVVVGEADDGIQALEQVEKLVPDVLLLDMEMPNLNGSQVAEKLRSVGCRVHILVLSAYDDLHYILSALDSGVAGYLTKDEVPQYLIKALRSVARGERGWLSQRVTRKIGIGS